MKKQSKKKLFSLLFVITLILEFLIIFLGILVITIPEKTFESNLVKQKSIIEEPARKFSKKEKEEAKISTTYQINIFVTLYYNIYINDEDIVIIKENLNNPYTEIIKGLTEDEKHLIYQITYLEAGNQSLEGQRAVIEVILNRLLSEQYPDTIYDVLSQPGQFATWKNRNLKSHNEEQVAALQLVAEEEPLLDSTYITFSRGKFTWASDYIKIGDHWFGSVK